MSTISTISTTTAGIHARPRVAPRGGPHPGAGSRTRRLPSGTDTRMPAAPAAQLRLTRRGRLVVLIGALISIVLLGVFVGAGSVATQDPGTPVPTTTVVVGDGESLWSISSQIAAETEGDVREVMFEIERLNALESAYLYAGQRLRVPTGGAP